MDKVTRPDVMFDWIPSTARLNFVTTSNVIGVEN